MTTSDPPVPGAYLHPTTAQSLRELLASRTVSVGDLAHMTGVPADTMRDAIQGKCPLEIGVWKAVATVLNANHAQFSVTTDERNGTPCLELYCVWT